MVGDCCGENCGNQTAYFQLYNTTRSAVKSVDATYYVGGPNTARGAWIQQFKDFLAKDKSGVDFITTHLHPTDPVLTAKRDAFTDRIKQLAIDSAFAFPVAPKIIQPIPIASTIIDENGNTVLNPDAPLEEEEEEEEVEDTTSRDPFNGGLIISEFSAGYGVHAGDEPYAAAFLAHVHISLQKIKGLHGLSYTYLTDVYDEGGVLSAPYHQGSGLTTLFGIRKPSFHAMAMIANLPKNAIVTEGSGTGKITASNNSTVTVDTVDAMFSTDVLPGGMTRLTALLSNYNVTTLSNNKPTAYIATKVVTVSFCNLPPNAMLPDAATVTTIDTRNGYAKSAWLASGAPMYPSTADINGEDMASMNYGKQVKLKRVDNGACYEATIHMQPQSVAEVAISF